MIVRIRWNLAKQLIAKAEEKGTVIPAMKRIHAPRLLDLKACRDVMDALVSGNFVIDEPTKTAVVEVGDNVITLTVDNCPKLNT